MTKAEQHMLECAGKMADIAGAIVGEGLQGLSSDGMQIMQLAPYLARLKDAVSNYNRAIIAAAEAKRT